MKTREIGHAAFAFTRMRFVRALVGSLFFNVAIAALIIGAFEVAEAQSGSLRFVAILVAIVLVVGSIVPLTIALNIADRLHRRLVAFASFYLALIFPLILGAGAVLRARQWRIEATTGVLHDAAPYLTGVSLIVLLLMMVLFVELVALAGWATVAPKAAFLSVRGWRPVWSRPVENLTHQLGFPAFAAQIRRGRIGLGVLYFLVAALNVVFLGVLSFLFSLPTPQSDPSLARMSLTLLAAPVIALILHLLGVGRLVENAARRRATRLYQDVREWDDRAPVLFLRQFDQDRAALPVRTHDPMMRWPAGLGRKRQLDEILLEAGAPFGPVIAIGDPRDPIPPLGAARVFVKNAEQNWKNVVADLIAASRAIVICPHTSAGVEWEIEQVRAPWLLARTIVLASPEPSVEDSIALFSRIADAEALLKKGRRPVAAYKHPKEGWTLLSARRLTVQTYSVALNRALQDVLGSAE